jgi:hypothetical protein
MRNANVVFFPSRDGRKPAEVISPEAMELYCVNTGDFYEMQLAFAREGVSLDVWVEFIRSIALLRYGKEHHCRPLMGDEEVTQAATLIRDSFVQHASEF